MDSNPNQNTSPAADNTVNSAKSFDDNLDMSAINDVVAMSGNADDMQKTFDVNEISLDNTPTTNAELEQQLKDDPSMKLSGATKEETPKQPAEDFDPLKYDPVNNASAPKMPESPSAASFVGGDIEDAQKEEPVPASEDKSDTTEAVLAADPVMQEEREKANATPVEDNPNIQSDTSETPSIQAKPAETPTAEQATSTSEPSQEPAAAQSAPEATPAAAPEPAKVEPAVEAPKQEQAAPAPAPAKPVEPRSNQVNMMAGKKKSNLPTILLYVLATIAVSATAIAIFYFFAK